MSTTSQFLIRNAGTADDDGPFIISAFDAALPFLESIGSHEQWGLTPFSHRGNWSEETLQQINDSEQYRLTKNSDRLQILIVERKWPAQNTQTLDEGQAHYRIALDGQRFLSVGFAYIRENWFPPYITSQCDLAIRDAERRFVVYIEVIVTDSRVGSLRGGAGAALLCKIREWSRHRGKRSLYLDAWGGNGRKLIRYYEQQGFRVVCDFRMSRSNQVPWLGTLMRMDIE